MKPAKKTPVERKMRDLRKRIDKADRSLLLALAMRMKTVREIGKLKMKAGIPARQNSRWAEVMEARLRLARNKGLHEAFTRKLFEMIHHEALRIQHELAAGTRSRASTRKRNLKA
jgi:chorismate mutase